MTFKHEKFTLKGCCIDAVSHLKDVKCHGQAGTCLNPVSRGFINYSVNEKGIVEGTEKKVWYCDECWEILNTKLPLPPPAFGLGQFEPWEPEETQS